MTVRPEDLSREAADAYRMWRTVFHLSESAALNAVRADGLVQESEFDRAAASFANIFNLSEQAAKTAARGRLSVSEAQRFWDSSAEDSGAGGDAFVRAERALSEMSDNELDQMYLEEQRRRKASKKATPASLGGSVKKQATVSERGLA